MEVTVKREETEDRGDVSMDPVPSYGIQCNATKSKPRAQP